MPQDTRLEYIKFPIDSYLRFEKGNVIYKFLGISLFNLNSPNSIKLDLLDSTGTKHFQMLSSYFGHPLGLLEIIDITDEKFINLPSNPANYPSTLQNKNAFSLNFLPHETIICKNKESGFTNYGRMINMKRKGHLEYHEFDLESDTLDFRIYKVLKTVHTIKNGQLTDHEIISKSIHELTFLYYPDLKEQFEYHPIAHCIFSNLGFIYTKQRDLYSRIGISKFDNRFKITSNGYHLVHSMVGNKFLLNNNLLAGNNIRHKNKFDIWDCSVSNLEIGSPAEKNYNNFDILDQYQLIYDGLLKIILLLPSPKGVHPKHRDFFEEIVLKFYDLDFAITCINKLKANGLSFKVYRRTTDIFQQPLQDF